MHTHTNIHTYARLLLCCKPAVDSYEFMHVHDVLTSNDISGRGGDVNIEYKPHFHEWATVQPGMICLARKQRTSVFRHYTAAETAVPVIACAAGLKKSEEQQYYFAGVARSKSVREPDDGVGPKTDEFFTVSLGGMVTVLNTSGKAISAGDLVEWCLATTETNGTSSAKRHKSGPRRVAVQVASVSSPKIIGRAISFAKHGEPLDILLKA